MGGITVAFAIYLIVPIKIYSFLYILFFTLLSSLFLSLLGIFCGVWSQKFDHMAALTNFVITPLTFLSGTFYSINKLPETWQIFAQFNPFFYMIDGFRYGFLGISDGNIYIGMIILCLGNILAILFCMHMFKKGYRLRS